MKRKPTEAELRRAWEDLCDGCGKCCAIHSIGKRDSGCGVACPSLDTTTNKCTVYKDRHKKELCLPVTPSNTLLLHAQGILPDSCAYVRTMKGQPLLRGHRGNVLPLNGYAKLLPFKLGDLDLQERYLLKREEFLSSNESDEEESQDDPPTSAAL